MRIIRLPLALPRWSSNLPGSLYGNGRFHCFPIWSCSAGGLPCRPAHAVRGALLPHRFTLASRRLLVAIGGLFSVALSVASPRLAVSQPAARRSSDFPLPSQRSSEPLHSIESNRCRQMTIADDK